MKEEEKQNLKVKINYYLLWHVNFFKETKQLQDIKICFDNVKNEHENSKDEFIAGLTSAEKKLIETNENGRFWQLKSETEFIGFLSNNEITLWLT